MPTADLSVDLATDAPTDRPGHRAAGSGLEAGDEVWLGITITDDFAATRCSTTGSLARAVAPVLRRTVVDVMPADDGLESIVLDVTLPYPPPPATTPASSDRGLRDVGWWGRHRQRHRL